MFLTSRRWMVVLLSWALAVGLGVSVGCDDDSGTETPRDAGSDADVESGDAGEDTDVSDDAGDAGCVAESDEEFCHRSEVECGTWEAEDDCGDERSVDCAQFDGFECEDGEICAANTCSDQCDNDDETICDGQCVDTDSDVEHCGDCATVCTADIDGAEPVCVDGSCDVECQGDATECGDQCLEPDECFQWEVAHEINGLNAPQVGVISRDGSTFAYQEQIADGHDRVIVRDADTGESSWEFESDQRNVGGLALGPEGDYLVVHRHDLDAGFDNPSGGALYDIEAQQMLDTEAGVLYSSLMGTAFSPDGQQFAWGYPSGIRTRSVPGGQQLAHWGADDAFDIDYSDGHLIHTSADLGVRVYSMDPDNRQLEETFSQWTGGFGVAIADDESFLAHQIGNGAIQIREVGGDWSEVQTLTVGSGFEAMSASGNGQFLAVEDTAEQEVAIFDTHNWTEVDRLPGSPMYVDQAQEFEAPVGANIGFSTSGDRLVVPWADEGRVYLYERITVE